MSRRRNTTSKNRAAHKRTEVYRERVEDARFRQEFARRGLTGVLALAMSNALKT